jgi:hypothetical protein
LSVHDDFPRLALLQRKSGNALWAVGLLPGFSSNPAGRGAVRVTGSHSYPSPKLS